MRVLDNGVSTSHSSCLLTGQVQSCIKLHHHSNWKKKPAMRRGEKGGIVLGSFCRGEWPPFFTPPSCDVGAKGTEGGIQTPSSPAPTGWAQRNPC